LNGFQQFFGRQTFQQIAARTAGKRAENLVGVLKNGEHQHLGLRHERGQLADTFNAVHAAEVDVHQNNVRLVLRQMFQRILGAGVCADAANVADAAR
jgi:hypothetical protein